MRLSPSRLRASWADDHFGLTKAPNTTVIPCSDAPCRTFAPCFVGWLGSAFDAIRGAAQPTCQDPKVIPNPLTIHNPHPSDNIPKSLLPLHLHSPSPLHPNLDRQPKLLMAHWHKGAILIWESASRTPKSKPLQLVSPVKIVGVVARVDDLAAIALEHQLYNDTARHASWAGLDRRRANGGLGEYYSEADTREPTWLIAGDAGHTAELVGLDGCAADGGAADPDVAARWLDDGIAPNGAAGRAFTKGTDVLDCRQHTVAFPRRSGGHHDRRPGSSPQR